MGVISDLVRWPLIQAPMGGGPSRPELAAAVSNAGGMGFLAAGYKTADEMLGEIATTTRLTDQPFGVNAFVPYAPPIDAPSLEDYLALLEVEAGLLGVPLGPSGWSDDDWDAKLAGLVEHPVAVVSFAFGCPSLDVIAGLHRVGNASWSRSQTPRMSGLASRRALMRCACRASKLALTAANHRQRPRRWPRAPCRACAAWWRSRRGASAARSGSSGPPERAGSIRVSESYSTQSIRT